MTDRHSRDVRDFDFDDQTSTPGTEPGEEEQATAQVVWTLDLDDAEELHHFLHHHRPGGYGHVHDGLADAIGRARREDLFGRFLIAQPDIDLPDIDRGYDRGYDRTP